MGTWAFLFFLSISGILGCTRVYYEAIQKSTRYENPLYYGGGEYNDYDVCPPYQDIDMEVQQYMGYFLGSFGLGQPCYSDDDCDSYGCGIFPLSAIFSSEAICYPSRCPCLGDDGNLDPVYGDAKGFCFCRPLPTY